MTATWRAQLATADAAVRCDLALARRQPRFAAALLLFLLMPALYALIYLSSAWDPGAFTRNLTVIVVNQDEGVEVGDAQPRQRLNMGRSVTEALLADGRFTYRRGLNPADAIQQVNQGVAALAIIVPADFSRQALEAREVGQARFAVHANEGNHSGGTLMAHRMAAELNERLNQRLNEHRFEALLRASGGSRNGLQQLRDAVAQLDAASRQLGQGTRRAKEAAGQLADGLQQGEEGAQQLESGQRSFEAASLQLSEGVSRTQEALRTLRQRLPSAADMAQLDSAALQLQQGHSRWQDGLLRWQDGLTQWRGGHQTLVTEVREIPFVGEAIASRAELLGQGAEQLQEGAQQLQQGSRDLQAGAAQLGGAISGLGSGLASFSSALGQLDAAQPTESQLEQYQAAARRLTTGTTRMHQGQADAARGAQALRQGLQSLDDGQQQLADAIQALRNSLPATPAEPDGTAAGWSESIKPALQFSAPVPNQGTALAPHIAPLSLWLGATLCAVLLPYHLLPASLAGKPRLGVVLGKLALPSLVVSVQALLLAWLMVSGLKVYVAHPWHFGLSLLLTGMVFVALLLMLVRLFGSAGRLVAVMLLALQMAAAGTMVPVELTSPFFQALHPWLPLSWSIKAMRIAMFDAYEGAWLHSTLVLLGGWATMVLASTLLGRWRTVADDQYRPLME
ncbi:MAG: YhgE/Pip family protein [Rubrivivax sp.]